MRPGLYMSMSVIVWSTYPLIVSFTLIGLSSISLAFYVQATAAAASFLVVSLHKRDFWRDILRISMVESGFLCLTGIFMSGFIYFLYYSLANAPKIHVVIILEVWPLLSMMLAPMVIRKQWKTLGVGEVLLLIVGFLGVSLALSEGAFSGFPAKMQPGHLTALLAALCTAVGTLLITRNAEKIKNNEPVYAVLLSQSISRTISSLILLGFAVRAHSLQALQMEGVLSVIYLGGFVMVLGSTLFSLAIRSSRRPSIVIVWYFYPILSVMLLYLFGFGEIYKETLIGAAVVMAVNGYHARTSKSS